VTQVRRHRAIGTILVVALSGFLMGFDGYINVYLAWGYVGFRILHSIWQATINIVNSWRSMASLLLRVSEFTQSCLPPKALQQVNGRQRGKPATAQKLF